MTNDTIFIQVRQKFSNYTFSQDIHRNSLLLERTGGLGFGYSYRRANDNRKSLYVRVGTGYLLRVGGGHTG